MGRNVPFIMEIELDLDNCRIRTEIKGLIYQLHSLAPNKLKKGKLANFMLQKQFFNVDTTCDSGNQETRILLGCEGLSLHTEVISRGLPYFFGGALLCNGKGLG